MAKSIANIHGCAAQPCHHNTQRSPLNESTMSHISSLSPVDQYGAKSSGYASEEPSDGAKSPLQMSLGFLKELTTKKPARVDGQTPKRRGPKPDSKPALTRRQELNRQAQRTHRERKELYIKALENELLRLKETYSNVSRDKDNLADENRQLKQLLAQHGINWSGLGGVDEYKRNPSVGYTSSGEISGSYGQSSQGYSPAAQSTGSSQNFHDISPSSSNNPNNNRSMAQQQVQRGGDYDQAGIDFVLTLERPCMDHMQFLVERSAEPGGDPCGHALMASCPPDPFLDRHPEIPFGHGHHHSAEVQPKTWDLSKTDLANLLDLSKRLNLDGEITPVMAWGYLLAHPNFRELTTENFKSITQELSTKARCYGFGAVLEEFEVRDALESVLYPNSSKMEFMPSGSHGY